MSRFALRSNADCLKMSENDADNIKSCKPRKMLFKKDKKKKVDVGTDTKEISNKINKSDSIKSLKQLHNSPISIVCSLPLSKISGILEKIKKSNVKSFKKEPNYENRRQGLIKDNQEYTSEAPCLCLYCDKKFSSQIIKKKHVEKIHTLTKDRRFSSRKSNAQSIDRKIPQSSPSPSSSTLNFNSGCTYCKNTKGHIVASAKELMGLFLHFINCHSDRFFGCKLCILRFQNQEKLTHHIKTVHKSIPLPIEEGLKSKDEIQSDISSESERLKSIQSHPHKPTSSHRFTSLQSQNAALCHLNCANVMKSTVFSGDEPILSRLGVAQNRLPSNRKSLRLRRDGVISDILLKSDPATNSSKLKSKVGKASSTADHSDVVFRVPTRTDMSCVFDDNFYEKVVSNVRNNIYYHLDGKIMENISWLKSNNTVSQSTHRTRKTLVKYPIVIDNELHTATQITTTTAFPTLLTADQYGAEVSSTKIKRSITKHSWKWKWDSFKKFKLVNEGGKIIKKIKQPILGLRDLSKLDMWTQLTMRQKNYLNKAAAPTFSGNSYILCREEKQRLNYQLNNILDTRLLPPIILEQSEQTIIKLEFDDQISTLDVAFPNNAIELSYNDQSFFSLLNLFPAETNICENKQIILSGEWARPRCYLCVGCGVKFEKLKALEEHKMFRHTHVDSTHYEIVGRELMTSNLLKHFFIPKHAFNRYESVSCLPRTLISNKPENNIRRIINVPAEEESSDSIQSILNSCNTTHSSKTSTDECDTDSKTTLNVNPISPSESLQSAGTSGMTQSLLTKRNKEVGANSCCTKCRRKCSGVLDLYRHMLDCSGDYIWNTVKKKKYRYYCGSKKRRHCNKTSNSEPRKKKQKTFKERSNFTELNNASYLKTKTTPRQRPSDAESIKKMLENLPPKRVCKTIIPTLNKSKKSRLMVKRKMFNSQVLKHKLSKRIAQSNALLKAKGKIPTNTLKEKCKKKKGNNKIVLPSNSATNDNDKQRKDTINKSSIEESIIEQPCESKVQEVGNTIECEESKKKEIDGHTEEATDHNPIILPSKKTLSKNVTPLEETTIAQTNCNEVSSAVSQPSISESGDKNNEISNKNNCAKGETLSTNLENTNCKMKRSKKINDCIAMLTGKLEEKLKTDPAVESVNKNVTDTESKKDTTSTTNKVAKRKACSRRIVKLDLLSCTNKEIPENTIHAESDIIGRKTLQQSSKPYKAPPQTICKSIPSIKEIVVLPNKSNLIAYKNESEFITHGDMTVQPLRLSETSTVAINSLNFDMPKMCSNPPFQALPLINHNTNQIFPNQYSPVNPIVSTLPIPKNNIPTRRQTICVDERSNFLNKIYDDIEPLDLSKKSKIIAPPLLTKITEIPANSESVHQIKETSSVLNLSPIIQNKSFYSNLELLRIPQVRNPCCLNTNSEKFTQQKITSRRKSTSKNLANTFLNSTVTSGFDKSSLSIKETVPCKKDNINKSKNTPKMDEVVINHIDDAINSVINAENELSKQESVQQDAQVEKETVIVNVLKESKTSKEPVIQKNSENKIEITQTQPTPQPQPQLTPAKRCVRSKTIDCYSLFEQSNKEADITATTKQINKSVNKNTTKDISVPQTNDLVDVSIQSNETVVNNKTESKQSSPVLDKSSFTANLFKSESTEKMNDPKYLEITLKKCVAPEINNSSIVKENVITPIKKPRKRRKNELAAIVADQLLESFKIDKARRDNLKKLENLAYDKSEDLLITGMLLMSSTKRNASSSFASHQDLSEKSCSKKEDCLKSKKQDQQIKNIKTKSKPIKNITPLKNNKTIEKVTIEKESAVKIDNELKSTKKKQTRKNGSSNENQNINKLNTSLESFSFDSIRQNSQVTGAFKNVYSSVETTDCVTSTTTATKHSTILRPSILSATLEPPLLPSIGNDSKTIISSRDPRLNKNIHKDENVLDTGSERSLPRNRLRSASNIKASDNVEGEICDAEEDNYLKEIARNVNEKIMSSENADFKFANDEFEVGSMNQDEFYRPSTSMSVRSAPNLNDDHSNIGSDGNTNTEILDMSLDDNLSVYTSFSQDTNRSGRKRRRRRSILLSRKPKKKVNRDVADEKFECTICQKSFHTVSYLAKHQTTLAHVSKVSEQEYLLSKMKNNKKPNESFAAIENKTDEVVHDKKEKERSIRNSNLTENENHSIECSKEKNNFNLFSRLKLNPDERLFFECCNILKGSQTSRTNDNGTFRISEPSNCTKYTYTYQEKIASPSFTSTKNNHPLNSYCIKPPTQDKPNSELPSQKIHENIFIDQPTVAANIDKGIPDDITSAIDQNNSLAFRVSGVTNTTSRFKTKAAMKGYENMEGLDVNHETKSRAMCKLTALAEIALGNENPNSQNLDLENHVSTDFTKNNPLECFNTDINNPIKEIHLNDSKDGKKNATYSTTSSKTIMHLSILKPDEKNTKSQPDKIIIPERPFKNIGLEEKETIKFQKPKTTINLLNHDENSVSSVSYSDRGDFDFGSLSCDDDNSVKNCNGKTDKNNCSSSSSSRITTKTFENKSLIMGRIFKNANGKNKRPAARKNSISLQKDCAPKEDLNQIFDDLRGNSATKIKNLDNCDGNRIFETVFKDTAKDTIVKPVPVTTNTRKKKKEKTSSNVIQNRRKSFSKLQSELGMSTEEIAQLINEGQRKSTRRCATNRPKKLVEMWSSDEYEEFLSTKDIFALIEEKEKEESKKKRKPSVTSLNIAKDKDDSAIEHSIDNSSKRPLLKRKIKQNKKKDEINEVCKPNKKQSTGFTTASKEANSDSSIALIEQVKKTKRKQNQKNEVNLKNGLESRCSIESIDKVCESSNKKKCKKNNKSRRRTQTATPNTRRKRLSSEKLYYWSSSSDEEFGRINTTDAQDFESGEQYQKHGWIVGDSHKKLVTLLAIAKGNKKIDSCSVKKETKKKRS